MMWSRNIQTLHGNVQSIQRTVHGFHRIAIGRTMQDAKVVLLRTLDCPCRVGDGLSVAISNGQSDVILALINRATGEGMFRSTWAMQPWPRSEDQLMLSAAAVAAFLALGLAGWPVFLGFAIAYWFGSSVILRALANRKMARIAFILDREHLQAQRSQ